jgi:hypothetical protein
MNPPDLNTQYWLLNAVNGWRVPPKGPPLQGLVQRADGRLTLQTLPGEAEAFTPDPTGSVACPAAMARDECGRTYILDAGADRVVRIDPSGTIRVIAEFGGPGREPRRFHGPPILA